MEQLSFLPSRGNRSSTGECGLDRDFVSWPYSLSRRNHPLSASGIHQGFENPQLPISGFAIFFYTTLDAERDDGALDDGEDGRDSDK